MQPAHLDLLQWVSDVAIAPDGDSVAIVVTAVDGPANSYRRRIEVIDTDDRVRAITESGGDASEPVAEAAAALGVPAAQARADLRPDDKAALIMELDDGDTLMVGDGVNDAPVLAGADVSIAMGSATALAKTSADIVLLGNRLDLVVDVVQRALRTRRVVRQNLGWALLYNFSAIPAAALGLVAPWAAALGMSLSSLLVVVNAMRLAR